MGNNEFTRQINLHDKSLLAMVEEKGRMVEQGRELAREMERLAKEHEDVMKKMTSLSSKLDNHKRKIVKTVAKLAKKEIGEYEVPVNTELKDGVVTLTVADALAEFQAQFKKMDKFKQAIKK